RMGGCAPANSTRASTNAPSRKALIEKRLPGFFARAPGKRPHRNIVRFPLSDQQTDWSRRTARFRCFETSDGSGAPNARPSARQGTKANAMKIKRTVVCVTAFCLMAGSAKALHIWEDPADWWAGHFCYDNQAPRYTAQELSFDMFGSFLAAEENFS